MTQQIRQAIETRALGPTNTLGARIVARCEARRLVVSRDYNLNDAENGRAAASALAHQLGWLDKGERLVGGWLSPDRYVWVIVE